MRLVDLSPRWVELDGQRYGFVLRSPAGHGDWLFCALVPFTKMSEQIRVLCEALPDIRCDAIVPAKARFAWTLASGSTFDDLTIQPSIDASASGNWHGFIRNGEIQ